MIYEDFEKEFNKIMKFVAENPEKFYNDEFTTFDELLMIKNKDYECWMCPGCQEIYKNSSIFILTLKRKKFSYTYPYFLDNKPLYPFPYANPKRCKIVDTPREIYDNYPDSEKLISIMNKWLMDRI